MRRTRESEKLQHAGGYQERPDTDDGGDMKHVVYGLMPLRGLCQQRRTLRLFVCL